MKFLAFIDENFGNILNNRERCVNPTVILPLNTLIDMIMGLPLTSPEMTLGALSGRMFYIAGLFCRQNDKKYIFKIGQL